MKKVGWGRLFWNSVRAHLFVHRRPGITPARTEKRERALPMLAKRFILVAFAALAIGLTPLAFPGDRDLFTDVDPMPTIVAAN